ncbi:uncharacterized protein F5147DRAFT_709890, partial [Suillus discolor]
TLPMLRRALLMCLVQMWPNSARLGVCLSSKRHTAPAAPTRIRTAEARLAGGALLVMFPSARVPSLSARLQMDLRRVRASQCLSTLWLLSLQRRPLPLLRLKKKKGLRVLAWM